MAQCSALQRNEVNIINDADWLHTTAARWSESKETLVMHGLLGDSAIYKAVI